MQKNTNKKYTSRYVLKIIKKELFIYLCAFLKHLKEKSQHTKISGQKLLITSWANYLYTSFLSI